MLSDILDDLHVHLNATILRQVLQEHRSKLGLDGAAQVAVTDCQSAQTLLTWLQDGHRDPPYSVTVPAVFAHEEIIKTLQQIADVNAVSPFPDDHFTHAIAQLHAYDANIVLETLTQQFYALLPKGITITTFLIDTPLSDIIAHSVCPRAQRQSAGDHYANTVAEQELFSLSEAAQFERGKTRWIRSVHVIDGKELDQLSGFILDAVEKRREAFDLNEEWKETLLDALKRQSQTAGGLRVEFWLMLAMRWDMLNG